MTEAGLIGGLPCSGEDGSAPMTNGTVVTPSSRVTMPATGEGVAVTDHVVIDALAGQVIDGIDAGLAEPGADMADGTLG